MHARVWSGVLVVLATTMIVGCGGDNLEFCDGCGTPTPTVTVTPNPTPTETTETSSTPPTPTLTPGPGVTPTGPFGT